MNPYSHLSYDRERRADLVREARHNELAAAIGGARRDERRSFLARLWERRQAPQPAPRSSAA